MTTKPDSADLPRKNLASQRDRAVALDAADPLAPVRARFVLPEGVIYLDGNSLGPLSHRAAARVSETVTQEWGRGLIRSWNDADWIGLPARLGARLAPLLGVDPDEVVVCDSTSLNLFKLAHAALALRPGRGVLLTDVDNFPTDRYLLDRVAASAGVAVVARPVDEVVAILEANGAPTAAGDGAVDPRDIAVVALGHVDYRSGRRHDLTRITAAARRCGALAVWDLAHSTGAMALDLHAAGVELAVGCTYKYLNGGPGAPAFAYVARGLQGMLDQPLPGWMGHAAPFDFESAYRPAPDLRRLLVGTPPVVALAALDGALDAFDGVDLTALRAKSEALTSWFLAVVDDELGADHPGLQLVTPREPGERGSQVTFRHPDAAAIVAALVEREVIGDFRAPDLARFGFGPLYLRYQDVHDAAMALVEVVRSRAFDAPRHRRRRTVT